MIRVKNNGENNKMKVYHLPAEIRALIFDMDLTLYTDHEYAQYQIDSLVRRLGEIKNRSFDEMKSAVDETSRTRTLSNNGKKPNFSSILNSYGVSTEEIVLWRNEILEPEHFIKEDLRLKETLEKLSGNYFLGLVTNNPVLVALKTITALGVAEYFPIIVGLDTCMISKPDEKPFLKFLELSKTASETCVSIGDRFDVDLDIPLKMGMGAILVDGVEDVYELPGIFLKGENYGI
jgi:phosphoglycolate phosphatase/putative hydrolase of the HAD superfamily